MENFIKMYFLLFCESVVSLLNFFQNLRLIRKRSIVPIYDFNRNWSHLLGTSTFNENI